MVESNYNYFTLQGENVLCMNGITGAVFSLKKEEFDFMKELMSNETLQMKFPELTSKLIKTRFLANNMEEEIDYLKGLNKRVNGNGTWHLIINPTQDCNFRCWYCYEKHPKGYMEQNTQERVKRLVDKIVVKEDTKRFSLAWFGGEPLLYFNEVVYPLSMYVKQCATEHDLAFINSMTTNGFLLTEDVIDKCIEIKLHTLQVTLDGDRAAHNKIRHQKGEPSFDRILQNCINFTNASPENSIRLRINYNTKSIQNDFSQVLDCIPQHLRSQFRIQFQRIWQTYEKEGSDETVKKVLDENFTKLKENGFRLSFNTSYNIFKGILCYADRENYANINYDGKVYRCTAQDYTSENVLGHLSEEGDIVWDKERTLGIGEKAFFDNPLCLECKYLAVCGDPCFFRWWSGFRKKNVTECPLKKIKVDTDLPTFIREYYNVVRNKG